MSWQVYDAGSVFQMQQVLHTVENEDGEDEEYFKWRIASISEDVISLSDPLQ